VRGLVPTNSTPTVARPSVPPSPRSSPSPRGPQRCVIGHDMRDSARRVVGRVRRRGRQPRGRRHRDRPREHRRPLLREWRPRPARRDVHREPQPGGIQRHQAVPGRGPTRRSGHRAWPRSATSPSALLDGEAATDGPAVDPEAHRLGSGMCLPTTHLPALAGRPVRQPPPAGRRRRGQRHGRAHRARGPRHGGRAARTAPDIVPLYFELDGTFPNHEANPLDPENLRRPPGVPSSSTVPTSAWPSTVTPIAASSSTSAVSR
jgi:hypothetical protein